MGIFQPGGAGTQVHVYDDNDATGGHTAGQPHTWAEISTAFPLALAPLQTVAGATFSATHVQYLCVVEIMLGNPVGGNANQTTLTDTTGADIFSPNGAGGLSRLRCTTANPRNVTSLNIGTKIGTGRKASGVRGGSIHGGSLVLRFDCNLTLYGSFVDSAGGIQILNGNGAVIDIAGCSFDAIGAYVFGTTVPATFTVYNTTFSSATTGAFCTNSTISDSANVVWAAAAPLQFFSSSTSNRRFARMGFTGAVTSGDIRMQPGAGVFGGYTGIDLSWSDTPGKPRLIMNQITIASDGFHDYRAFDCKVVDANGNALAGIPVYLENDVDGVAMDTVTLADGNVSFTNPLTGAANAILVRDYYDLTPVPPPDGSTTMVRDRTFTLWINSYKSGMNSPNQNYETKEIQFEWPGRDRFGTGYQTDGGSFLLAMDIVQLANGTPSIIGATTWVELSL